MAPESRSRLVLLAIVIFAISSSAALLWEEFFHYDLRASEVIGIPAPEAASLRKVVPSGETLGFITDNANPELVDKALYAANYSLAPIIVEKTVNRRILIGNFRDSSSLAAALRRYSLKMVRDLGNSFVLLESR